VAFAVVSKLKRIGSSRFLRFHGVSDAEGGAKDQTYSQKLRESEA